MNTTEDTLWEKGQDLLEQYEDLKEELSAMSLAYEHPPLLRERCEKLDASVEYVNELSPLAAPELDRLREERFRQWEADRATHALCFPSGPIDPQIHEQKGGENE